MGETIELIFPRDKIVRDSLTTLRSLHVLYSQETPRLLKRIFHM